LAINPRTWWQLAGNKSTFTSKERYMATKNKMFKTIPVGTKVSWHYRSAIGHGTVTGVSKMGTNAANTMYSVRETDHHPGEPAVVRHSGKALKRA
jgi:hypothetical protein